MEQFLLMNAQAYTQDLHNAFRRAWRQEIDRR
jgi:hypothetical protein